MTDEDLAEPDTAPSPEGRAVSRRVIGLVSLLLLALVVAAIWAGLRSRDRHHQVSKARAAAIAEADALQAGREEAVALTTLSYRDPTGSLDRILAGATGRLKSRFSEERTELPKLLMTNHSVSTGSVLSAGLAKLSTSTAQALVAVDATVSGTDLTSPVVKHYRVVVTLQRVSGQWLASDVAFAGVPPL